MFIIGIVVGGFMASLLMALVTVSKKADCMEADYDKSRFIGVAGRMKSIISRFAAMNCLLTMSLTRSRMN